MRLLVSVANGDEAAAALAGGADIIDAKDPAAGPLGAVTIDVLLEISRTVTAFALRASAVKNVRAASVSNCGAGLHGPRSCYLTMHSARKPSASPERHRVGR
jgi:uncharacterized protein (UPF0264 family)